VAGPKGLGHRGASGRTYAAHRPRSEPPGCGHRPQPLDSFESSRRADPCPSRCARDPAGHTNPHHPHHHSPGIGQEWRVRHPHLTAGSVKPGGTGRDPARSRHAPPQERTPPARGREHRDRACTPRSDRRRNHWSRCAPP